MNISCMLGVLEKENSVEVNLLDRQPYGVTCKPLARPVSPWNFISTMHETYGYSHSNRTVTVTSFTKLAIAYALMHTNGFKLCNMSAQMVHFHGFIKVVIFIKNCLYCYLFRPYVGYTTA